MMELLSSRGRSFDGLLVLADALDAAALFGLLFAGFHIGAAMEWL